MKDGTNEKNSKLTKTSLYLQFTICLTILTLYFNNNYYIIYYEQKVQIIESSWLSKVNELVFLCRLMFNASILFLPFSKALLAFDLTNAWVFINNLSFKKISFRQDY
ncbi:hypothetical protein BpHYR1_040390 [Brachionus plicatilis]|uniref:Uncharacterized protein n=1 Tax=Brachionus plicatilis TaxID=10195 RepID=A0A3M7RAN3_BRAPC|nr:hypothetical protein BpHYR1_040390 [Brachionus plicatilis]